MDFTGYLLLGAIGLGVGALVGGLIGSAAGTDKKIQIEGMSGLEIEEAIYFTFCSSNF